MIYTCNSGGKIGSCVGSKGKNSLGSVNAATTCVKDSHMIKVYFETLHDFLVLNCKFRKFRENFIFENSVKIHVCNVKNSQLVHDLPTSVNGKSDFSILRGFLFWETTHPQGCVVSQK